MIKNFIFDVDRTLIDSYKPELDTLKKALKVVTGNVYSDDIMNKLTILTTDEFFSELGIEKDSQMMKDINHYWGAFLAERKIIFFESVRTLLESLNNNGCFLGIATSRTEEELNELEELIGCIQLFDVIITSDKVSEPKPSPESINVIIENYNLNKDETIYIGDSESDSVAARNAGVLFGYANWENKNPISYYDYLFETPMEISELSVINKKTQL